MSEQTPDIHSAPSNDDPFFGFDRRPDELGRPLSDVTFVVFDLETTGGSAGDDEVTPPVQLLKRFPTAGLAVTEYARPNRKYRRKGSVTPPWVERLRKRAL